MQTKCQADTREHQKCCLFFSHPLGWLASLEGQATDAYLERKAGWVSGVEGYRAGKEEGHPGSSSPV